MPPMTSCCTWRARTVTKLSRDDAEEILSYREDFERLRQASLGPERTIDFLREVIAQLSVTR